MRMGKGIALIMKQQFPQAYAADLATVRGARDKLGTVSTAEVDINGRRLVIVNGYTQFDYKAKA